MGLSKWFQRSHRFPETRLFVIQSWGALMDKLLSPLESFLLNGGQYSLQYVTTQCWGISATPCLPSPLLWYHLFWRLLGLMMWITASLALSCRPGLWQHMLVSFCSSSTLSTRVIKVGNEGTSPLNSMKHLTRHLWLFSVLTLKG